MRQVLNNFQGLANNFLSACCYPFKKFLWLSDYKLVVGYTWCTNLLTFLHAGPTAEIWIFIGFNTVLLNMDSWVFDIDILTLLGFEEISMGIDFLEIG